MNKIYKLLDEKFVTELFTKKVLPKYPSFDFVKSIKISTPKSYIWKTTYHVVIKYITTFITKEGKRKKLTFYAAAHSNEQRKNVYDILRFLWTHNFNKGYLTIPHPLFFDKYFNAVFYRGVDGKHLYHFICENELEEIEKITVKTALWFAKLHKSRIDVPTNFNIKNNEIKTVVPGIEDVFKEIGLKHPLLLNDYKKIYDILIAREEKFLNENPKRWLVHGDAHPENVIKMSEKKLAMIDFADMCLTDFARDLGSFQQQIEYMMSRKIDDKNFIIKIKDLFLNTYLNSVKIKLDKDLEERIDNYYNWTTIRTATYFFIKHDPDYIRGMELFNKVKSKILNY
ncbi:aminoglycoside phosphotransferase family protein [Candidatus Parcubacteria bacterium]|nr:aminoglycoside phosphotransferase family protein [Candidatus Parcubacteria bacterium]